MVKSLHGSSLQLLFDYCDFLNTDISLGSAVTYLRCGGIFKYKFVANLSLSLSVKEFWKSVNIWGSYGQEFSVLFFLTHSVEWREVVHLLVHVYNKHPDSETRNNGQNCANYTQNFMVFPKPTETIKVRYQA